MKNFLLGLLLISSIFSNAQFGNRNALFSRVGAPPPVGSLVPFSFVEIPYSDPDLINHGRGAEQWHNGSDGISYPTSSVNLRSLDLYYRGQWVDLEGSTQGSYTWITNPSNNWFDNRMREAINAGQQFSFGIMPYFSGNGSAFYDGARSAYPQYLHNAMQALPLADRDAIGSSGDWMPNWNSTAYLSRLRALHVALNDHILNTSYTATSGPHQGQSIRYRDVIFCIDIRGFGNYGEFHSGEMFPFGGFPGNTQPTEATLIEIIDTHTEVFQDWWLVMMVAAYNGSSGAPYINIFHPYNNVGYYALKATNNYGKVGHRRDQFGAPDNYLDALLQNNNTVVNGERFGTLFVNLFKNSPGTGEPYPNQATSAYGMQDIEQQVIEYSETSFGNGNWNGFPNATQQVFIRNAFKRSGYRLKIVNGEAPNLITRGIQFQIKTNWVNVGVCPAYNDWEVVFQLQVHESNIPVWTGTSSKVLKLFRPDQGTVLTTDNFTVPGSVSPGTYKLVAKVRDPNGYRYPMKLANQGINADTSYTIFSSVTLN